VAGLFCPKKMKKHDPGDLLTRGNTKIFFIKMLRLISGLGIMQGDRIP
jgi:hypothetical protein